MEAPQLQKPTIYIYAKHPDVLKKNEKPYQTLSEIICQKWPIKKPDNRAIPVPCDSLDYLLLNYSNLIDISTTLRKLELPRTFDLNLLEKTLAQLLDKRSYDYTLMIVSLQTSFDLITLLRVFKDNVDWRVIQKDLLKEIDNSFLEEFKDYLIFTDQTISSSEKIVWSEELIKKYYKYWDWKLLSANKNIPFTEKLIAAFEEKWNWAELCKNNKIVWDFSLLGRFISKLEMDTLILNKSVNWKSLRFYLRDSDKYKNLRWDIISNTAAFAQSDLEESKIEHIFFGLPKKMESEPLFYGPNPDSTTIIKLKGQLGYNGRYYEKMNLNSKREFVTEFRIQPSISTNTHFRWTDSFLNKHLMQLDFWLIGLRGRLSTELVIKYAAFFDEIRPFFESQCRHSDWGYYPVHTFHTGWHNLSINPNFIVDEKFLEFAKSRNVRILERWYEFHNNSPIEKWIPVYDIFTKNSHGISIRFDYSEL